MLSQIPTLPTGAIENWLLCAFAVVSMAALGKKLFGRKTPSESQYVSHSEFGAFREGVHREWEGLRDRLDARFLGLSQKMEQMKDELLSAAERHDAALHRRINDIEAGLARVDERTKQRP
jgi:hypothetical protein